MTRLEHGPLKIGRPLVIAAVVGEDSSAVPEVYARQLAELHAQLAKVTAERDAAVAERGKLREAYKRLQKHYFLLKHRIEVAMAERIDTRKLELEFAETKTQLDELVGAAWWAAARRRRAWAAREAAQTQRRA